MNLQQSFNFKTTLLLGLLLTSPLLLNAQDPAKLFKANCSGCHKTTDQRVVGPGLLGVKSRWPDSGKLNSWIKNSTAFLKTGDPYANKLYEEYGKAVMPAQDLTDAEITSIIDWVDVGGDAAVSTDSKVVAGDAAVSEQPIARGGDNFERIVMIILVVVLALIIIVLSRILISVIKYSLDKSKVESRIDISDITSTIVEKMIEDKIIKNSKEESITVAINEILANKLNTKNEQPGN